MRQSVGELISVVYRYYPRGVQEYDPGYNGTEEHRRLVQGRIEAGREGNPWRHVFLDRLSARLPGAIIQDGSLHLPMGANDAGYVGWLKLPPRGPYEKHHKLGFLISFLVPCYVVYSAALVLAPTTDRSGLAQDIRFTFTADEEPYVQLITEEIRSAFPGYEPMPPEIGNLIVPDVVAGTRRMGEATLFHCLFTDAW